MSASLSGSPDVRDVIGSRDAPAAVVIGLDCITGLQTTRLLARRGIPVVGIAADPTHPGCRTNTSTRVVTSPLDGPGLIHTLRRLAPELPGAVLIPCTDTSVRTLSHARSELPTYRMALPDGGVVDTLMAKDTFERHADDLGIEVPRSRTVASLSEAIEAADALRFPCVVKPTFKTPTWDVSGPKVRWFDHAQAFVLASSELLRLAPRLVVQEWIPGDDSTLYSCNCYVSPGGIPMVTFVARKLRQWPPRLGTSSAGEAVVDDAVRDLALRVLLSLPFQGLGYVEMKRDARTGRDVVIEANVGRPTGRSAIAEAGGVELLRTMYCDLIGAPLPSQRKQREGVEITWVHLTADIQAALHYRRTGELTLRAWLRSLRGPKTFADLDLSDPRPFIHLVLRRIAKRRTTERRTTKRQMVDGTPPGAPSTATLRSEPAPWTHG